MTGKIFRSTFLTSALVLLSCLVLIVGILFEAFENRMMDELSGEAAYVEYAIEADEKGFFENFSAPDRRVTLISPEGTVLADTSASAEDMDNHSGRAEFKEAITNGSGTSVRYSDTLMQKTLYYAKKLPDGRVMRISTTQSSVISLSLALMQPICVIVMIALILSFLLSKHVSKSITAPINAINPDDPENCVTYDELSPLLHKILNQKRTIKKQIAEAKQKQEEFRIITENMSEGFLIADSAAQLLSCNSAALRLLGGDENTDNVFELNRTEKFRKCINDALGGKHAEEDMQHGERTYKLIASPVKTGSALYGVVMVIVDITESTLRESMRREFTANVSHELKTPLTSISGFAELMKSGNVPAETVADFSSSIYSEAQRLITLVNDIIEISQLDEKGAVTEKEEVALYPLCQDIINRLTPLAEKKNVTFEIQKSTAVVKSERRTLDEIIYNLCDNAVKYNNVGGSVSISIFENNGSVGITVSDNGIGIDPSLQDRVFERFYRVDKSRSKNAGGTGLGLSIVKHGAMRLGAQLKLESAVGDGTKITLTFEK